MIIDYITQYGISSKLPDIIPNMLKQAGLSVTKDEYPPPGTKDKIAAAQAFRLQIAVAMPSLFLRLGHDEVEATKLAERNIKILERYFADGWYPVIPAVSVVGQKD